MAHEGQKTQPMVLGGELIHSLPPSLSFLLNAFSSEFSIWFLFLFNFLIYLFLLIYIAWVVVLLETLIKEN